MGLPGNEDSLTISWASRFDTIPACDGQTDGRTDIQPIAITCALWLTQVKNEKIRVTLCENAAGALYIVNNDTRMNAYQVWQIIALALGSRTYWINVVQQLTGTIQHLLLVALDWSREVAAQSTLTSCTQWCLVKVLDVAVNLLDWRVAFTMPRRVLPDITTNGK